MTQKKRRKPRNGSRADERLPEDEIRAEEATDGTVPIEIVETRAPDDGAPLEDAVEATPLERAEARAADLEQRVKLLQADFLNETRRIKRQAQEGAKFAIERVVLDLLTVFDALHMARQGADTDPAEGDEAVSEGMNLLERELLNVLGRHGVERMDAEGEPFDPAFHEALFVVDRPDLEPSTVAQVLRPGFMLHGRVVRAAHVAVTKGAEAAAGDASPSAGETGED